MEIIRNIARGRLRITLTIGAIAIRVPFNKSRRSGHLVFKKVGRSIRRPSACTRQARDRYGRDGASALSL